MGHPAVAAGVAAARQLDGRFGTVGRSGHRRGPPVRSFEVVEQHCRGLGSVACRGLLWRFGGRNNQFQILDDPLNGFNGQHTARILDNGNLLLYDNGLRHAPPESRAVEYHVDPTTLQARMVWQFRHEPLIFTQFVGSAQRLLNGNTLVGFAQAGIATEVTSAGDVVWEATFKVDDVATAVYRFDRIASLYEYEKP